MQPTFGLDRRLRPIVNGRSKAHYERVGPARPGADIGGFRLSHVVFADEHEPAPGREELRETLGRATLKLVAGICQRRHQRGRYYLLENPAGSAAWVFDGILAKLLERYGWEIRHRRPADVDLQRAVVLHLADSGHANGTPEKDDILRYRSVGGYFIMLANPEILQEEARCNIICFHSGQTKRVCRSTLAAEASHLAEAVEAGDWVTALLEEALNGNIDLRNWSSVIEKRQRVYVTDAKSVFDYLQKDATSTSSDKRMAIEGALLRETVRKPGSSVRWIDGMQNIANVLTKANAEKETLREFLRTGTMSLVQTAANRLKEKKKAERQRRHQVKKADTSLKDEQNAERRAQVAREVEAEGSSGQD